MTRPDDTEPSAEALEAWLKQGSAYAGARILLAVRTMDAVGASGDEQADFITLALDRFRAAGVEAERERCIQVAEAEPEFLGEPPCDVMEMLRTEPVEVMRIVCRVTKREIIKRMRDQP